MVTPRITIKVKAGVTLAQRIEEAAKKLDVSPNSFVEYAISQELDRQERLLAQEHVTLTTIRDDILRGGQELHLSVAEDAGTNCELCLKPLPPEAEKFDGPSLCDDCLKVARSGPPTFA